MKKVLVVLLALAIVLSMTGMAFAFGDGDGHKKPCCPSQKNWSKVKQKVHIDNFANSYSGDVNATGNVAPTVIAGNTSSADSCAGCATNTAPISVTSSGGVLAGSGDANTTSTNTNNVGQRSSVDQSNCSTCESTECNTIVIGDDW